MRRKRRNHAASFKAKVTVAPRPRFDSGVVRSAAGVQQRPGRRRFGGGGPSGSICSSGRLRKVTR